jgi:ankyrin repeat protein
MSFQRAMVWVVGAAPMVAGPDAETAMQSYSRACAPGSPSMIAEPGAILAVARHQPRAPAPWSRTMPDPAAEIMAAVIAGDAATVRRLVAEVPSLAASRGEDGVSALLQARYRNDRATIDALMSADPELDLFEAAALGYVDRVRERLDADPGGVNAVSRDGFTPLHLAAFFGKVDVTRLLLASGADVAASTRNSFANQPLHAAAAGGHVEICRMLLAAGADVGATEHGDLAPLHQAAQHGDDEMVELFLSAGADPTAVAGALGTAADVAEAAGHPDVAHRLRDVVDRRA